ncbi:hypothetical protein [Ensifer aridi]|uniref:hypothetical protein n=1 Tax=Ensifer aridi TaxID=1708715 RepID=UPI0003FB4F5A
MFAGLDVGGNRTVVCVVDAERPLTHASNKALLALASIEALLTKLNVASRNCRAAMRSPGVWMSVPGVGPITALAFIAER